MTLWAGADHEVVFVEMTGVELRASRGMERRALSRLCKRVSSLGVVDLPGVDRTRRTTGDEYNFPGRLCRRQKTLPEARGKTQSAAEAGNVMESEQMAQQRGTAKSKASSSPTRATRPALAAGHVGLGCSTCASPAKANLSPPRLAACEDSRADRVIVQAKLRSSGGEDM
jgi:hypothetical protein